MPGPGGRPGDDRSAADLERWAAEARAEAAADDRAALHWSRQAAEESAGLASALLDLAERSVPVVVCTSAGRRHRGVVAAVAHDFVAVRLADGPLVLVDLTAIAWCRPQPDPADASVPAGWRPVGVDASLIEVLAGMAGDGRRIQAWTGQGEPIGGRLRAAGRDVVTVQPDGSGPPAFLARRAITEVLVVDER